MLPRILLASFFQILLALKDESIIQAFSERYAVDQDFVVKYIHHLANLQMMKQKRERERKEESERQS